MALTKLHPRDLRRISNAVQAIEGAPIVHPNDSRRRRSVMFSLFRRVRISDYAEGSTHYKGYLLDHAGQDEGDEIEIYCQRGVIGTSDIRNFWPRLIASENGETHYATDLVVVPVTETVGEEIQTRWYLVMGFGPWCEDEARQGVLARFPVTEPPGAPQEPSGMAPRTPDEPPGAVRDMFPPPEGTEGDDIERLIAETRGGRPCDGCGDG